MNVRVAIVAESFLPHVNGVSNSVLRILEHCHLRGVEAVVLAPGSRAHPAPQSYAGAIVRAFPSLPVPGYPQVRIAVARDDRLTGILSEHQADIIHLASPFLTGLPACRAASRLGAPVVAAYQTDLAAFVARYGLRSLSAAVWRRLRAIHGRVNITLAPSSAAMRQLHDQGIPRVALWSRGVDAQRFHPNRRSPELHRALASEGQVLVGYMGRLAPEKCLEDLRVLRDIPGVRLVLIGDGPDRARLERLLPDAVFLGLLQGDTLATAVATLDIGVHTGPHETFCQSLQELLASGVPAVSVAAGGPLDLIEPSRNGWLYPPGDLDGFRAKVADLAGDLGKARAMGRRARAGVAGRTWERIGDELLGHYTALTGQSTVSLTKAA